MRFIEVRSKICQGRKIFLIHPFTLCLSKIINVTMIFFKNEDIKLKIRYRYWNWTFLISWNLLMQSCVNVVIFLCLFTIRTCDLVWTWCLLKLVYIKKTIQIKLYVTFMFNFCVSLIASFVIWFFDATNPILLCLLQYFWRRRMFLAKPLLKTAGIASIILENPYCIL